MGARAAHSTHRAAADAFSLAIVHSNVVNTCTDTDPGGHRRGLLAIPGICLKGGRISMVAIEMIAR
jgi:hypothetical protein